MEIVKIYNKLSNDERETTINFSYVDKIWRMDSFVRKHFNRAIKQGWTPVRKYVYEDGTIVGMTLTAPAKAITIRNAEKKQLSKKQFDSLVGEEGDDE